MGRNRRQTLTLADALAGRIFDAVSWAPAEPTDPIHAQGVITALPGTFDASEESRFPSLLLLCALVALIFDWSGQAIAFPEIKFLRSRSQKYTTHLFVLQST
jgi:hypothetical protein